MLRKLWISNYSSKIRKMFIGVTMACVIYNNSKDNRQKNLKTEFVLFVGWKRKYAVNLFFFFQTLFNIFL